MWNLTSKSKNNLKTYELTLKIQNLTSKTKHNLKIFEINLKNWKKRYSNLKVLKNKILTSIFLTQLNQTPTYPAYIHKFPQNSHYPTKTPSCVGLNSPPILNIYTCVFVRFSIFLHCCWFLYSTQLLCRWKWNFKICWLLYFKLLSSADTYTCVSTKEQN